MRASLGFTTWPTDYLAQLNLGLFRAPLDAPQMAEFTAALGPIKAIAESTTSPSTARLSKVGPSAGLFPAPMVTPD